MVFEPPSLTWNSYSLQITRQGRSHAFKSGGPQNAKIILGPIYLKKWEGPNLLLLWSEPKTEGAWAPWPIVRLRPWTVTFWMFSRREFSPRQLFIAYTFRVKFAHWDCKVFINPFVKYN